MEGVIAASLGGKTQGQNERVDAGIGILRLRLFIALAPQRTILAQDDNMARDDHILITSELISPR